MSSNFILILCLLAGFVIGFFNKKTGQSKAHALLLFATIIILIFCMGVILGYAPDLPKRMALYGYNALVITVSAIVFSAVTVWVIVKITGVGKRGK